MVLKKNGDFFENLISDIFLIDWTQFDEDKDETPEKGRLSDSESDDEEDNNQPKKKYNRQEIIDHHLFS
jgi:hypothetical protein